MYIYIYMYIPLNVPQHIVLPPSISPQRTPRGHVDVQRFAAKEGAPQDQALHLRLRALRRRRDAMGKTGGQPRKIRWLHGFFRAFQAIMSQNHFKHLGTPQTVSLLNT